MTRLQEFALGFGLLLIGFILMQGHKILEVVTNKAYGATLPILLFIAALILGTLMIILSLIRKN